MADSPATPQNPGPGASQKAMNDYWFQFAVATGDTSVMGNIQNGVPGTTNAQNGGIVSNRFSALLGRRPTAAELEKFLALVPVLNGPGELDREILAADATPSRAVFVLVAVAVVLVGMWFLAKRSK